jgi:Dyp-type peroxidase family
MPVNLNQLLTLASATADEQAMLDNLQANILRPHVRDHMSILFLSFADQAEARAFLVALATPNNGLAKSATTHFAELAQFHATGAPGTPYVGVGLSATGYAAIGINSTPADTSFARGMTSAASRGILGDSPVSVWEQPFRQLTPQTQIHAVVAVGDATDAAVSTTRDAVLSLMTDSITLVTEETGLAQRNAAGEGIEHFGYIDGRSQPLFIIEDVTHEQNSTDGTDIWNPNADLTQVLVPDPAAPDPTAHFGSYFIFRKLEQNVRRFRQSEHDLAVGLGITDADRAGAMIVGRFRDGTPLTLQRADSAADPIMNNFTYDSDVNGDKCPFHGHIRKTNPRGSGGAELLPDERQHLMARRGQTYGNRTDVPFDETVPITARPTDGVGLLFMAFNSKINFDVDGAPGAQFDFTQAVWANNPGFPVGPPPPPGLDPVIGQGARPGQSYPLTWGESDRSVVPAIAQAVRMRGGEYFFMPSLPFLRGL